MNSFIEQLHFIRPLWLWAILLILPLIALLWRQQKNSGQWQDLISADLLPFLLEGKTIKRSRGNLIILMLAWIIAAIALAGPSWKKLPVAVEKNTNALIIILDLSPSMLTEDIKPSRMIRARLKIADLLRERQDGQTALLVYGANAHVVTPLTQDSKTISNLLPMLSPNLMPAQGSNTESAVARAVQLLKDAGLNQGDLLLITDGVTSDAQQTINENLQHETGIRLSILGVGGKNPAPIPSRNGGFLRDKSNDIVTSFLDEASLREFASHNRGRYKTLSSDVNDMKIFTSLAEIKMDRNNADNNDNAEEKISNRTFDQWADEGHWLALLLLPIILYAFRRGTLAVIFFIPLLFSSPEKAYAMDWMDLWKNQDQQAYEKLQADKADEAAKEFTQPEWKASAEYRAGNFAESAKQFADQNTASGHYNRGNALAKSGQLDEAIKAYEKALSLDANLEDAQKNRKIVEEALKKQQEQQQQEQNNQDQKQKDKNSQDQNKKDQQEQSQQNQEQQQDQDQQNQNQKSEDGQQQQDQQQDSSTGQNSSSDNQSMEGTANSSQANPSAMDSQASSSTASQMNQASQTSSAQSEEQKSDEQKEAEAKALAELQKDGLTDEERKNLEQWLRRVQDDPSGLLRRKFENEFRKQQYEKMKGTWESPDNEADQRL
jgi:Ca-activated chloride channel homolog